MKYTIFQLPLATSLPLDKQLRWTWELPLWATVFLAGLATVWIAVIYFREISTASKQLRAVLVLMRLATLLLIATMFAQPTEEWFIQSKPRVVVLIDCSASMQTIDVRTERKRISRLAAIQTAFHSQKDSLLSEWRREYDLEIVAFNEEFSRVTHDEKDAFTDALALESSKQSAATRLGDAIDYALRDLPGQMPAAVVVLTDGISNRGRSLRAAATQAHSLRTPLFSVAVGSKRRQPDIAVEDLLMEEVVFPGDRLQVVATLRAIGLEGEFAQVKLRNAATGAVLGQASVQLLADDALQTARVTIRPDKPGELALELFVEPHEKEANTENNIARQVVEVRDEKIQVLLVQSSPSYEFRALKSLLERDPIVALKVWLQEADPGFAEVENTAIEAFPTQQKELLKYDVIILGDVDPGLLPRSTWPILEDFVAQQGGGLACIAGPRFMPQAFRGTRSLELLLPIELTARNALHQETKAGEIFSVHPTPLGWQSPSSQLGETQEQSQHIWQNLPELYWLFEVEKIKPGAQVLAEQSAELGRAAKQLPIILRHYVGAGEVLFHATDETWRWRWRTDDRYFARYWGQVVRRLGRGRLASGRDGVLITTDRTRYQPGEQVRVQVRFRDPAQAPASDQGVVVQLQPKKGLLRDLKMQRRWGLRGVFEATLNKLPPDDYEIILVRPEVARSLPQARFRVQPLPREKARVTVDRKALQKLASLTGGKYYTLATINELRRDLPRSKVISSSELPPHSLWNTNSVLAVLVTLLCSEWILRRRNGML